MKFTAEFVERGYNNRAAVPDHPRWFALGPNDRAAARGRAGAAARPALRARTEGNARPVRPRRHGARHVRCSFTAATGARSTSPTIRSWRRPFVAEGIAVAVANYDLCPDGLDRDHRRRSAGGRWSWLAREGTALGANAERIVVGGHSAGGHLAAMMFATDWARSASRPAAARRRRHAVRRARPATARAVVDNSDLQARRWPRRRGCRRSLHAGALRGAAAGRGRAPTRRPNSCASRRLLWDAWPRQPPAGCAAAR